MGRVGGSQEKIKVWKPVLMQENNNRILEKTTNVLGFINVIFIA